MKLRSKALIALLFGLGSTQPIFAQVATVQQPVVERFSLGTTVSVPDRGRTFLGGVSSGGESRSVYGPLRSGTNSGRFHTSSTSSVTAHIMDFEELDRAALEAAASPAERRAAAAANDPVSRALRTRQAGAIASETAVSPTDAAPGRQLTAELRTQRAEEHLRLGIQAVERGQIEKAKFHFRLAQKHGSPTAEKRLTQLSTTATVSARRGQ